MQPFAVVDPRLGGVIRFRQGSSNSAALAFRPLKNRFGVWVGEPSHGVAFPLTASASVAFSGDVATGQGSQSTGASGAEAFSGAILGAQGGQSTSDAASEIFTGLATSGQGSQSSAAAGTLSISGTAASEQASQSTGDAVVPHPPSPVESGGAFVPRGVSRPIRWGDNLLPPPAISGAAAGGQGEQESEAHGTMTPIPAVRGVAMSGQLVAAVDASGAVDNRRPMNMRKARLAVALLNS